MWLAWASSFSPLSLLAQYPPVIRVLYVIGGCWYGLRQFWAGYFGRYAYQFLFGWFGEATSWTLSPVLKLSPRDFISAETLLRGGL
jgi:hypothetical protein